MANITAPSENPAPEDLAAGDRSPWKFAQWFRKMKDGSPGQAAEGDANSDHLSAVQFSDTGEFLATGDRSGNLVVLQQIENNKDQALRYAFATEFITHYPQFDFVKSQQVDEAITQVNWGAQVGQSLSILVSNEKSIKLFRVKPRTEWQYSDYNVDMTINENELKPVPPGVQRAITKQAPLIPNYDSLKVPKRAPERANVLYHRCRRQYTEQKHFSEIVGLATSPDKNNFISADSFQIQLWDFLIEDRAFNVLDIQPDILMDNPEQISGVDFNPNNDGLFLYSTTYGNIRLADMRSRSLTDYPVKTFPRPREDSYEVLQNLKPGERMMRSVSKAKFSKGGRFVISRDFMSIKIWDMNMESRPVETFYVQEFLRQDLQYMLEKDHLARDAFSFDISKRGDIVTGTYGNHFHVFDLGKKEATFFQASKPPMGVRPLKLYNKQLELRYVYVKQEVEQPRNKKKKTASKNLFSGFFSQKKSNTPQRILEKYPFPYKQLKFGTVDKESQILSCSWHPNANGIAVAGQNNLFVYSV